MKIEQTELINLEIMKLNSEIHAFKSDTGNMFHSSHVYLSVASFF